MMGDLVPALHRFGELAVTEETAASLIAMSAATMDRRLAQDRVKLTLRGRSHTKPGSLLKAQIPIRTWHSGTRQYQASLRSTWSTRRATTQSGSTATR